MVCEGMVHLYGGRGRVLQLTPHPHARTHTHTHTPSQGDWSPSGGDSAVLRVLHRDDCGGDLHQLLCLLEGECVPADHISPAHLL